MKTIATLAVLACFGLLIVMFWPRPKAVANIGALRGVLEKSASESMPAPDLTSGKIRVNCPVAEMDSQAARIIKMAADAGGTAFRSKDASGGAEILASIPSSRAAAFRSALTGGSTGGSEATPGDATELIDIILSGSASIR